MHKHKGWRKAHMPVSVCTRTQRHTQNVEKKIHRYNFYIGSVVKSLLYMVLFYFCPLFIGLEQFNLS